MSNLICLMESPVRGWPLVNNWINSLELQHHDDMFDNAKQGSEIEITAKSIKLIVNATMKYRIFDAIESGLTNAVIL